MPALGGDVLKLEMASPERPEIAMDALEVTVPGLDGVFTVLPGHTSLMSLIAIGVIEVHLPDGTVSSFYVDGGYAEVLNDRVVILSQAIERGAEIDVARAESAKERAEERLKAGDSVDVARAEYALRRALARLRAGTKTLG